MLKLTAIALLLAISLVGCKGVITGREYSPKEMAKIAEFVDVSVDRLNRYKDGDITIEELGVSADRLQTAVEYVKGE